jgi:hypothetical protein
MYRLSAIFAASLLAMIPAAQGSTPMQYHDVTTAVRVLKNGKLLILQDDYETPDLGSVSCVRLVYVLGTLKVYPEKNLSGVERIFEEEGFHWGDSDAIGRIFVPSLARLYIGFSRVLLDRSYYVAHKDAAPEDRVEVDRLERECRTPTCEVAGDRWRASFCVMQGGVNKPVVERYTFSGVTSPFRISAATVEVVDFTPTLEFKTPAPQG